MTSRDEWNLGHIRRADMTGAVGGVIVGVTRRRRRRCRRTESVDSVVRVRRVAGGREATGAAWRRRLTTVVATLVLLEAAVRQVPTDSSTLSQSSPLCLKLQSLRLSPTTTQHQHTRYPCMHFNRSISNFLRWPIRNRDYFKLCSTRVL